MIPQVSSPGEGSKPNILTDFYLPHDILGFPFLSQAAILPIASFHKRHRLSHTPDGKVDKSFLYSYRI